MQGVASRFRHLLDVLAHAAADVEQQQQRERFSLTREVSDVLRHPLILDNEVGLGEIRDQLIVFRDLNDDTDVGDTGFEDCGFAFLRPGGKYKRG